MIPQPSYLRRPEKRRNYPTGEKVEEGIMPTTTINGLTIHYLTHGSGPALLMLAPGGFDATIEKWSTAGVWAKVRPLDTFSDRFTCIAYDRRESGASGGRVERL